MYDDSMVRLHRIYRICQCKWLSDFPSVRETIVNPFPSPEKFWFTTGTIESMEWLNLVPRQRVWTEHPHTAYFLAHFHTFHPCAHAPAWLKVSQRVSHKNMFTHMSFVWLCVVSPSIDLFLSFECLHLLSILFISSILVIILAMWSKPPSTKSTAHPQNWGVLPRGNTQPSHRLWAQPARQLRLLRDSCSDFPEWIRRHRHGTVVVVRCGTRRWAYRTKLSSSWNSFQECARHGRIAEMSCVKGRWTFKKKIDWSPKHNLGAKSQNSGITEWSQLYEWLEGFQGCRVSTQWTIPRSQSSSVTSTLSWSRWIAKPQQSAAIYLEFAGYIGKLFCKSNERLLRHLIQEGFNPGISNVTEDTPVVTSTVYLHVVNVKIPDTALDSEISDRTVSQKFIRP